MTGFNLYNLIVNSVPSNRKVRTQKWDTTQKVTMEAAVESLDKPSCAVETTIKIIGGRWKVLILRELLTGVKRFAQLQRALPGITQKMLTQQLRELEQDGIIHRQVYPQVPPKVEYSLTPLGTTLQPVLNAMHQWGMQYLNPKFEP